MKLDELLKTHGIEDETVEKILAGMKENKIFTAGEENLDIRFGKLKTEHDGKLKELEAANELIAELQKSTKGNEDLQGKIAGYEQQVTALQEELQRTKLESAIKVGLLSENALDVDYLTFKLKEKGELSLDENEKIKDWDDKIAALKTQFPTQFQNSGEKKIQENKLPGTDENKITKNDILSKPYAERAKFAAENPDAYNEIMKG